MKHLLKFGTLALTILLPQVLLADEGGHGSPYASDFLAIAFLLVGAMTGSFIAKKLGQPRVLGELLIGIVIGSAFYYSGDKVAFSIRHQIEIDHVLSAVDLTQPWESEIDDAVNHLDIKPEVAHRLSEVLKSSDYEETYLHSKYALLFSSIGVLLLLFMVGLEVRIEDMLKLGRVSFSVAFLGVLFPFLLGYLITKILMPETDDNTAIFIGATLAATSIGITARVFKDANILHLKEAQLVLGAAVIDDILGLVLLAIVTGIVTTGSLEFYSVAVIMAKAVAFLGLIYLLEVKLLRKVINGFSFIAGRKTFLYFPFVLLMVLSYVADAIGLASIVGAFCAGLILRESYFDDIKLEHQSIEDLISPIEGVFAPIFFVMMGFQVDAGAFTDWRVLSLGLLITIVAIVGKMAAGIFIGKGYNKWLVGVGLIPRGEVGLIFASIGKSIGVLNDHLFAVIIVVVILTTLITPPALTRIIKNIDTNPSPKQA